MQDLILKSEGGNGISDVQIYTSLLNSLDKEPLSLKKVLLIPPDLTRMYSGGGKITAMLYEILRTSNPNIQIDIMPALGTHEAMTEDECLEFFGRTIPMECIIAHDWKNDIVKIGEVPAEFVSEVSKGLVKNAIAVEVNKRIMDESYDLIISIGQVVPHEVVGMANYSKNIFVGCGGNTMINQSHMLGAFYGMEKIMGRDFSPVRKVLDYAEENFINKIPLTYILTVTTEKDCEVNVHGLFIGRKRSYFEEAVALSQEKNLSFVDESFKKVVVYLDEREFKSTWLGNKAVYRTRMAMAQDGELIILAPGVRKFGEDDRNDELIRKYGYVGRKKVLGMCDDTDNKEYDDLRNNLSVAAHLIHGSSDGKFSITYAVEKLTREEVEDANFKYASLEEMMKIYDPAKLEDGWNVLDSGEKIYYISNPALGLWATKEAIFGEGK
jgi:nickel-dependent lactate racemase